MAVLPSQRHLFDIPDDVGYFNCSFNAPQLRESTNRLLTGVRTKSRPWERTSADFFDSADAVRDLAARVLGGEAEGYAVVPAVSYGISTAARAIEPHLGRGDCVLVLAEEFPSNVLPWRRTVAQVGAALLTVPNSNSENWTQSVLARLEKRVKVVAISPCHWTNGARLDLGLIAQACRNNGSTLVVDASQTLGAVPFAFDQIKPDFLVAAGYKWLLCPYGFSLLYVGEKWRDSRPLEESWLARKNAEDFAGLVKYSDTYMAGARRFDVGQKCTATLLPGAITALEQLGAWGVGNIAESLAAVNSRIAEYFKNTGCYLAPDEDRCPHMFGVNLPQGYSGDLVSDLRNEGIYVSRRGSAVRFSPHLHISTGDVDRLLETLGRLLS